LSYRLLLHASLLLSGKPESYPKNDDRPLEMESGNVTASCEQGGSTCHPDLKECIAPFAVFGRLQIHPRVLHTRAAEHRTAEITPAAQNGRILATPEDCWNGSPVDEFSDTVLPAALPAAVPVAPLPRILQITPPIPVDSASVFVPSISCVPPDARLIVVPPTTIPEPPGASVWPAIT